MKSRIIPLFLASVASLLVCTVVQGGAFPPDAQARIDAQFKEIITWAANPLIVEAVRAHNAATPAEQVALTQEKWRTLTVLDPLVWTFARNPAGQFLKTKRSEAVTEAFVSDAKGLKVAFITKPTNWSHAGKPKHDVPMTGKTWQGPIEVDESTGQRQIQLAVPVRDGGQVIGSLVVGLNVAILLP